MDKCLSLLTICKKAGKLEIGMDSVKDSCNSFKAKCVVVSTDISPKSLKEILYTCRDKAISVFQLEADMNEIWSAFGRKSVVLAVCDKGFAVKVSEMLKPVPDIIKKQ